MSILSSLSSLSSLNNLQNNQNNEEDKDNTFINLPQNIHPIYPPHIIQVNHIRPNLVLDLNGILLYSSHLSDPKEILKYTLYKNFLLIYKDFDSNMFIIYYRNFIKEFLLELNNYYNIYIYSTINRTQTDLFVMSIIHLIGINIFKGVYIKHSDEIKSIDKINLDPKNTIIIDINESWKFNVKNLILINIFKGPYDINYEKNNDLFLLKKCLCRIYKLFVDNSYGDITDYIPECI